MFEQSQTQPPTAQDFDTIENGETSPEKPRPNDPTFASHFSRAYLVGPVKRTHVDLALLACCFVTGLVDAASFANWSTFVGMQTGNTVILGLSASSLPDSPYIWLSTLVSIASYLVGCFFTFQATRSFAPTDAYSNRLVVVSLFLIQSLLLILSAALATPSDLIPQNPPSTGVHTAPSNHVITRIGIVSLIPPLAFQSGIQIACSRLLGFNEIPVNVLTSVYCDIMGDPKVFALNNVKRNRRAAAVLLLIAGSISSGWLMRSAGGLESVLWIAAGIKFLVAGGILCFLPGAELFRSMSNN